jgi:hypothetical protein
MAWKCEEDPVLPLVRQRLSEAQLSRIIAGSTAAGLPPSTYETSQPDMTKLNGECTT